MDIEEDGVAMSAREIAARSIHKLTHAKPGERSKQLNTTSYLLGRMVAADVLTVDEAADMITRACACHED
jgi:hypothetical protein